MKSYKNRKIAMLVILFVCIKVYLSCDITFNVLTFLCLLCFSFALYVLLSRVLSKLENRLTLLERIRYNASTILGYMLLIMLFLITIYCFVYFFIYDSSSEMFYWDDINIFLNNSFNITPNCFMRNVRFITVIYFIYTVTLVLFICKSMNNAIPHFGVVCEFKGKFDFKANYFIPSFFVFIIALVPVSMIRKIDLQIGLIAITSIIPLVIQFVVKDADKFLFDIKTFDELMHAQKNKYLKTSISSPSKYYFVSILLIVISVLYFKFLFIIESEITTSNRFCYANSLGLFLWFTGWVLFLESVTTFYYIIDQVFNNDFLTTTTLMWCDRNEELYSSVLVPKETYKTINNHSYEIKIDVLKEADKTETVDIINVDDFYGEYESDDFNIISFKIPVCSLTQYVDLHTNLVSFVCKCYYDNNKVCTNEFMITIRKFGAGLTFLEITEDLQKVNILDVKKSKFGMMSDFCFKLRER